MTQKNVDRTKLSILINSMAGGGAERVVSILLEALKEDFDIHLVLLDGANISYQLPVGQKLHVLKGAASSNKLYNIAILPLLGYRYKKYCRRHGIQISLSLLNRCNFINCFARLEGWKGRLIISERAYSSQWYQAGITRAIAFTLIRKLYPLADLIIPISRGVEVDLRVNHKIKNRYNTIYNPIDVAKYERECREKKQKVVNRPFTFISLGRLDAQKNQEVLIRAFAQLSDLDCRLQILGHGPYQQSLEELVRELKLEGRVELAGFQKDSISFLANADCKVLSSDFEGLGNVLLEGLACSLPVISTDCFAGPREILAPGTDFSRQLDGGIELAEYGILTPVKDAEMLAKAMRLVYEDEALRQKYIDKAFGRAKMFDVNTIATEFRDAIQSTMNI